MVISEAVLAQLVASGALSQAAMAELQPSEEDAVAGAIEEARGQVRGGSGAGGGQPGVLGRAAEGTAGTQIPRRGGLAGPGADSALGGL